jgi:hypothetical protein
MADYYQPRNDREAVLLTHALAWESNQILKTLVAEHEDTRRRVVRIETVGKIGTVLVSVGSVAFGALNFVLKVL